MFTQTTNEKLENLRTILCRMDRVLIAYSGGVDSTFLLRVASDVLGDQVLAVTAASPTYPIEELDQATVFCRTLGVKQIVVTTDELAVPEFCANPPERCYHCKKELFGTLQRLAEQQGICHILDASNADDCADFRPGRTAAQELGVRSPLVEAGLGKTEIRALSRELGLPTWNKPAMACLASRFPYGETITSDKLTRIEQAESFLRQSDFRNVRVRAHGDMARIEVAPDIVHRLTESGLRATLVTRFKELGFVYVTVDLQGYRTGSMNEVLPADIKARHAQAVAGATAWP